MDVSRHAFPSSARAVVQNTSDAECGQAKNVDHDAAADDATDGGPWGVLFVSSGGLACTGPHRSTRTARTAARLPAIWSGRADGMESCAPSVRLDKQDGIEAVTIGIVHGRGRLKPTRAACACRRAHAGLNNAGFHCIDPYDNECGAAKKYAVQDDEWDGYDMYDMDAGSGEEGRRRAAIAAELRPVSPTDCAAFDIDQIIADAADPVSPRLPPPVCLLRICRAGAH